MDDHQPGSTAAVKPLSQLPEAEVEVGGGDDDYVQRLLAAQHEVLLQQLAALEAYRMTSSALFQDSGDLVPLRLADGAEAVVPASAQEVATGATEAGAENLPVLRVPDAAALQPYMDRCAEASGVRAEIANTYIGHADAAGGEAWRWYGLQLPVVFEEGGGAVIPCSVPHGMVVMPMLGQRFALYGARIRGQAVLLLYVVRCEQPSLIELAQAATTGGVEAWGGSGGKGQPSGAVQASPLDERHGMLRHPELLEAVHASARRTLALLEAPGAGTAEGGEGGEELLVAVAVPQPPPAEAVAEHVSTLQRMSAELAAQSDAPVPLPQLSAVSIAAHAQPHATAAAEKCPLEAAVEDLIERKKNKYVQRKSNTAWRLEPHLPRDIAGDVADAIGKTRLAGYGLLTSPVKGGIFREFLVCSTHERWWSCVDEGLRVLCAPRSLC
jgi:hypothetical protein